MGSRRCLLAVDVLVARVEGVDVALVDGDRLPKLTVEQIPVAPQPEPPPGRAGTAAVRGRGPAGPFDAIYVSATRDDATHDVILKLVNIQATAQPIRVDVQGIKHHPEEIKGEVLIGALGAVNTVTEPRKVAPVGLTITHADKVFSYSMPPHSVTVLRVKT